MQMVDVIFYISDRRIGVIRPNGSGERYPRFDAPNQVYWQLSYVFSDGCRAVLWSQEPPRNPDAAFSDPDGLGSATTHLWHYDLVTGEMNEIAMPTYSTIIGFVGDGDRFLVMENTDNTAMILTANLDGGDRRVCFTSTGYAYGASLSPDGRNVAFHIVGAPGAGSYEIHVVDLATGDRTLIASDPAWLYFAPTWSPDGRWLLYQRCAHQKDPGHDRSDLCLSRSDGSAHRTLTSGQSHWFAAAYGTPERHSSGSNGPAWSPDGLRIACALLLPDSRTAWPYRIGQPDLDHFNRDYRPDLARGGTRLCLIDPEDGSIMPIVEEDPPTWFCRPVWSADGHRLAMARVHVGCQPELQVMDADGGNRRSLTRGIHDAGADHFRWVQLTEEAAANL